MAAQEMVLPDGYDEHGYEEGGDEEDDDVETGSRRRDPWEKDQFTGVCSKRLLLQSRANNGIAISSR